MYNTNPTNINRVRSQETKITSGTRHRKKDKQNKNTTQSGESIIGDRDNKKIYVGGETTPVSFEIFRNGQPGGDDDCRMFVLMTSTQEIRSLA